MNAYVFLALAIACEVAATLSLRASDGFARWLPSLAVVVGYAAAFGFMSLALKGLPLGLVYAIWAGAGTALVALLSVPLFGERIGVGATLGIALIVTGVVVLNLFSTAHGR